jgi:hypothetical protein
MLVPKPINALGLSGYKAKGGFRLCDFNHWDWEITMIKAATKKFDIYQHVTEAIPAEIEQGCAPRRQLWIDVCTGL